ncbi:MAG: DUF116 domain-containing protein [Candidatus Krumholzibacteriota bacterium]|nr:DUF116 domain-containing protein [Candidatus Krumholzibacteriota bacterium]
MNDERDTDDRRTDRKRVLGEEWTDWDGTGDADASAGKRPFLLLSLVILIGLILLGLLFWYLVLPRFEAFGGPWPIVLTVLVFAAALLLLCWYLLLLAALRSRAVYTGICLTRGANLFFFLLPVALRFAAPFGLSRDRLSHSFIRVSNQLVRGGIGDGPVLTLLPRCLRKDLLLETRRICGEYEDVAVHTAPGGSIARKIIKETRPRAIVAVACERDLVSGIQDIAPVIPVIGLPNTRPAGPCKDTEIDLDELRSALDFFTDRP